MGRPQLPPPRKDWRGRVPGEPPPQGAASTGGRGLLPPWAGEGKTGDELVLCW